MTRRYWIIAVIAVVVFCLALFGLLVYSGLLWSETVCEENGIEIPCRTTPMM